jgi:hypothetical protein
MRPGTSNPGEVVRLHPVAPRRHAISARSGIKASLCPLVVIGLTPSQGGRDAPGSWTPMSYAR